jgi:hypothetical protein
MISRSELTKEITEKEDQETALKKQLVKYFVTKFMRKKDTDIAVNIKKSKKEPFEVRLFVCSQYMEKTYEKLAGIF